MTEGREGGEFQDTQERWLEGEAVSVYAHMEKEEKGGKLWGRCSLSEGWLMKGMSE